MCDTIVESDAFDDAWQLVGAGGLRIVDQDLWDAVAARLTSIREASGADAKPRPGFHERRKARHILTGKVFCANCGSACGAVRQDYLSCNAARRQGTCDNRASIRRPDLETLILDALRHQLVQLEHVAEFVAAYTAKWNHLATEHSATTAAHRRELNSVTRKLDGLIDAIAEGLGGAGVQQKLDTLEARKADLTRLIATSKAPPLACIPISPRPSAPRSPICMMRSKRKTAAARRWTRSAA